MHPSASLKRGVRHLGFWIIMAYPIRCFFLGVYVYAAIRYDAFPGNTKRDPTSQKLIDTSHLYQWRVSFICAVPSSFKYANQSEKCFGWPAIPFWFRFVSDHCSVFNSNHISGHKVLNRNPRILQSKPENMALNLEFLHTWSINVPVEACPQLLYTPIQTIQNKLDVLMAFGLEPTVRAFPQVTQPRELNDSSPVANREPASFFLVQVTPSRRYSSERT